MVAAMNFEDIRSNQFVRIVAALLVGVGLYYAVGYLRLVSAPIFVFFANSEIIATLSSNVLILVLVNSSHSFFAALLGSVVGLAFLLFLLRINSMFLPLLSCLSFAIMTYWWFFSNPLEMLDYPVSYQTLVALFGNAASILAWLFASWMLTKRMHPDMIYLWGTALMLGSDHDPEQN